MVLDARAARNVPVVVEGQDLRIIEIRVKFEYQLARLNAVKLGQAAEP